MGRAGVVDDDVDMAQRIDRSARGALDLGAARNVGMNRHRRRTEPFGGRIGDVAFQVQACDPGALADERFGDAEPEPLPRAGDQRGLAFQSHGENPDGRILFQPAFRRSATSLSSISRARRAAGRALTTPQ